MTVDVLVVGAGIGGAVLALDLGRRGWRVAIVEREVSPRRISHPEILWGPTVRALDRYDVGVAVREVASVELRRIEIGAATPWLSIAEPELTAGGGAFSTNPSHTRQLIAEAAVATGNVEIHRGVVVTELLTEAGRGVVGVRGTRGGASLEMSARIVVGDDGGKSVVRSQLGINVPLASFPFDFITARVPIWPLPPRQARVWIQSAGTPAGVMATALIPWPQNEGVMLMPVRSADARGFLESPPQQFWDSLERVTPVAAEIRRCAEFPREFARVARPFGHAERYVGHGVALIGDAAHPMSPAGGQGANAAVADAMVFAQVADRCLRSGDVSQARLSEYEKRRRASNQKSLGFSRSARRLFALARFVPVAQLAPVAARIINASQSAKRKLIQTVASTYVTPGDAA